MIAVVAPVRLTSTCAYGPGNGARPAFGTLMSKPILSAEAEETPRTVPSSAAVTDAIAASRLVVFTTGAPPSSLLHSLAASLADVAKLAPFRRLGSNSSYLLASTRPGHPHAG